MLNEQDEPGRVGRFPQPGELWSLWDMHQIYTHRLLEAARVIGGFRQWLLTDISPESVVDDETASDLGRPIGDLVEALEKIGAKVTIHVCREILDALEDKTLTNARLSELLRDADETLFRETQSVFLYAVDVRHARYLDATDPPFGSVDFSKFGEASGEIAEASKCLALRRNKAAVFHLMLAMEEAIRALAARRGATTHTGDGRWLTWLVIANNIDGQVIGPMPPGPEKVAWQNANSMLKSVGHAWRNPTDHPGSSYSEEDAETIFQAVKGFMRALAPLI